MTKVAKDYEDVTVYKLDPDREQELLDAQRECTFMWTNKQGEPVGVIMSYLNAKGKIWLTAAQQRLRIPAVRRDPRTCICITSTGTSMGPGKTVTYKGTTIVHDTDNREVKDWFYRPFAEKLYAGAGQAKIDQFVQFLDSPARVVLEFTPTKKILYDGDKMAAATPEVRGAVDE